MKPSARWCQNAKIFFSNRTFPATANNKFSVLYLCGLEVGLSAREKMPTKIFVRRVFAIFVTNASFLRLIANLQIRLKTVKTYYNSCPIYSSPWQLHDLLFYICSLALSSWFGAHVMSRRSFRFVRHRTSRPSYVLCTKLYFQLSLHLAAFFSFFFSGTGASTPTRDQREWVFEVREVKSEN